MICLCCRLWVLVALEASPGALRLAIRVTEHRTSALAPSGIPWRPLCQLCQSGSRSWPPLAPSWKAVLEAVTEACGESSSSRIRTQFSPHAFIHSFLPTHSHTAPSRADGRQGSEHKHSCSPRILTQLLPTHSHTQLPRAQTGDQGAALDARA